MRGCAKSTCVAGLCRLLIQFTSSPCKCQGAGHRKASSEYALRPVDRAKMRRRLQRNRFRQCPVAFVPDRYAAANRVACNDGRHSGAPFRAETTRMRRNMDEPPRPTADFRSRQSRSAAGARRSRGRSRQRYGRAPEAKPLIEESIGLYPRYRSTSVSNAGRARRKNCIPPAQVERNKLHAAGRMPPP